MARNTSAAVKGGLALGGLTAGIGGAVALLRTRKRFDKWALDILTRPRRAEFRRDPADFGLAHEEVTFQSDDGITLSAWLIRAYDKPEEAKATLIMGHGYTANKDSSLHYAAVFPQGGYNVLMLDFRAHGTSGGEQTSMGFVEHQDVHGAIRFLQSRSLNRIGFIGFSQGAAIGTISAALYPEIRGLISDSGFARLSSPLSMALHHELQRPPWLANIVAAYGERLVARDLGFDWRAAHPVSVISQISPRPVFIIHSKDDELIPVSDAHKLYDAAHDPKQIWIDSGGSHIQGLIDAFPEEYKRRTLEFWSQVQWE